MKKKGFTPRRDPAVRQPRPATGRPPGAWDPPRPSRTGGVKPKPPGGGGARKPTTMPNRLPAQKKGKTRLR